MTRSFAFHNSIDLHVERRISPDDARRQTNTAIEILRRLREQPGVVLADEVGMGKTFVALAVGVSVALNDRKRRQVVVMVPPSLKEKWPRDFDVFRERCLPADLRETVAAGSADTAVAFLKLLDDPEERRKSLIFVTHGAMSRGLTDRWVKLALIQKALKGRHDTEGLKRALDRVMGHLIRSASERLDGQGLWHKLMDAETSRWLSILQREGIDLKGEDGAAPDDDPVPQLIADVLSDMRAADTSAVYAVLQRIPLRQSKNLPERVKDARQVIQEQLVPLWARCLGSIKEKLMLPLLILDEAHHLKNPETRLASLFHDHEAEADAAELGHGSLAGVFERMLFLTATPFQLGHEELCAVLDRFAGIDKSAFTAGAAGATAYQEQMKNLRLSLDRAKVSAVALDHAWGKLRSTELLCNGKAVSSPEQWWAGVERGEALTNTAKEVIERYRAAQRDLRDAEEKLKPWVIRHLKPRQLPAPFAGVMRRERRAGEGNGDDSGIGLGGEAILPFLLAARASYHTPKSRPVFAEGLASSYEAFLDTRRRNLGRNGRLTDEDDDGSAVTPQNVSSWYLDELERLLPGGDWRTSASHPKIAWTLERVLSLWRNGEKVVVFCHYISTGRTLRQVISNAIRAEITAIAAKKLKCTESTAEDEMERIGKRFFDVDSPLRASLDELVQEIIRPFAALATPERTATLTEIVRRNLRTPAFLARFFPLEQDQLGREAVLHALENKDQSGLSLRSVIERFCDFLEYQCGERDTESYLGALSRIQVGSHAGADVRDLYSPEELEDADSESLMPNVRLVNGRTHSDTRQRLMLAFNTPFYPEVLVASSVLAEGVDLHLNCRHVIHHDLCWNPSTLEQRTGRVDRIGSKAERCGLSIQVMLPFIGQTQDEKMYRVVMDRERWFQVVMGEDYRLDLESTEKLAERVSFPEAAARALVFDLSVPIPVQGASV